MLRELVGRRLCASSYVVKYAVGVLTFVSNLLDLSPLNGLLISCINQVNCEHICSVHASAHAPVCLYIHLQPTNLLSLSLCIRCVCTGMASRARRGSGGDSERNVRWFCWSRNSSGPPREQAQTAAAVPRRRGDCIPPW